MIQQVMGAAEMGEVDRMIEGDDLVVPTHALRGSQASNEPSKWVVKQSLGLT
jgi:hypothetical protein